MNLFNILDDEREDCQEKNFRHKKKFKGKQDNFAFPPNKQQNHSKPNETEKPEGINFLFHTEFTDSEDEKAKMSKEKNTKLPEKKRKFEKNPKQQLIPKKMLKTRDSVKEFTGICMSDSEDEITTKSILINSLSLVEKKSIEVELAEKPSEFFNSHITDSENEAPEEKPIERQLEDKIIQDEGKTENANKNENCKDSSIKNIAMNYFSAYMSDSEEETISEQTEDSKKSGLQIPDYNVLVKMNN